MRRLPWAEEYLDKAEVVVKDPAAMKGRWREIVQGERVHLEIGCGKGDYWNLMAQKQPQDGWIAVEKNVSVAGIAVRKFDTMNNDLNRMRFIWGDAEKLDEWFAEDEIDILVDMGCGDAQAKAWGCDLTYDYVKINGDYRT